MIAPERINEVAAGLEDYLCKTFNAKVVTKEDSDLHNAVASFFGLAKASTEIVREAASLISLDVPALRLPSSEEYLKDFSTTIGAEVALPRRFRTPETAVQRLLLLPHEVGHVVQHTRGVDAGWWPKATTHSVLYLCSIATDDAAEYVGHVEGDQYACTEAVRAWLNGGTRRPKNDIVASLVRHYSLAGAGADVASATLTSHYATMDDGGIPNVTSARVALDWLERNAADLKGRVLA